MNKKCISCGNLIIGASNARRFCAQCYIINSIAKGRQSNRVNNRLRRDFFEKLSEETKEKLISEFSEKFLQSDEDLIAKRTLEMRRIERKLKREGEL